MLNKKIVDNSIQYIITILILFVALIYAARRLYLTLRKSNNKCYGCKGCQLQKKISVKKVNKPKEPKEPKEQTCFNKK